MSATVPDSLTDLESLRTFLGLKGQSRDTELKVLIRAISGQILQFINRLGKLLIQTRVEQFDVNRGQITWQLKAIPVTSVTSVIHDTQRQFTGSPLNAVDYHVDLEAGLLHLDYTIPAKRGALQVTYVGGLVTSVDQLQSCAPDLELACQLQIQAVMKRQQLTGEELTVAGQGGSTRYPALELIPAVKELLRPYIVPNVGHP